MVHYFGTWNQIFVDTLSEEIKTHFSIKMLFPKMSCNAFLKNLIPLDCTGLCYCAKDKAFPLQDWTGPEGSRRLRLPDFKTSSIWRKYSRYSFLLENARPLGHSAAGWIMSMKNSNDTIGNRTRDLPACSTVPPPTAPPRFEVSSMPNVRTWLTPTSFVDFLFVDTEKDVGFWKWGVFM